MSKQVRSFDELMQPSNLDYEGWLGELPSGDVNICDIPKEKQLQISSWIGLDDPRLPEEDSDSSSGSDMGPSQLKFKKGKTTAIQSNNWRNSLQGIHIQMIVRRKK